MADDQQTPGGFLDRLRNSPRTVSTIIVILIIAGAIFAFSDRGTQPSPSPAPPDKAMETAGDGDQKADAGEAERDGAEAAMTEAPATPTPLPTPSETEAAYTEVAEPGEGITHLARKATARYLAANPQDFNVTNEHRIYTEDYLKDKTGREGLALGETRMFTKDLIREAVGASRQLTDAQLTNLQRYSRRVQFD